MRISDWSSDVCSSDLLVLLPDDGQFFGFQNNSRGKLQRHTSFVFVPAVREASADAADGKASVIGKLLELLVRSQKIGRASCRESVCQYVYLSVVAVSLKKQVQSTNFPIHSLFL